MKKIAALFALVLTMSACSDEITRNNPAFEGLKDGDSWRAADVTAIKSANGTIILTGATQYETLVLKTVSPAPSTYTLGTGIANQASFLINQNLQEISYQTGVDKGEGKIIITEFDDVNQTITGSFEFKAPKLGPTLPTDLEPSELHFQKGVFYKIPLESEL